MPRFAVRSKPAAASKGEIATILPVFAPFNNNHFEPRSGGGSREFRRLVYELKATPVVVRKHGITREPRIPFCANLTCIHAGKHDPEAIVSSWRRAGRAKRCAAQKPEG